MNFISSKTGTVPCTLGDEISIIHRRERELLLVRAQKVLMYYREATDCSTALLDRNGLVIKAPEHKNQMDFCNHCKKCFNNSPADFGRNGIGEEYNYPCTAMHSDALAESRRLKGTYVYTCKAGFIHWTSPLYHNGRYAGALAARKIISGGYKAAAEIQAMARLLDVCAAEISERNKDSGGMIHRMVWQKRNFKNAREPLAATVKNGQVSPSVYPLEMERMFIAAFRRGDNETGCRILKKHMDFILTATQRNLESIRFRALELIVLLSRAAVCEASGIDTLLEANNQYLRWIQESKTVEELFENLHLIVNRIAVKIFSFQGIRHASVLRRAERYIWENYTRKISLEEIAKASGLSAPYFSTIFKEEMGENLSGYLNRIRVGKASTLLTETGKPLNEIAGLCGFDDQGWFSKTFKKFTGMSPRKYRENGGSPSVFRHGRNHSKGEIKFPESAIPEKNNQNMLSS